MATTVATHQRKVIALKHETVETLSQMAAEQGLNINRFIEHLLDDVAEEYDDNAMYAYLTKHFPEGRKPASKKEQEEFRRWLGI